MGWNFHPGYQREGTLKIDYLEAEKLALSIIQRGKELCQDGDTQ